MYDSSQARLPKLIYVIRQEADQCEFGGHTKLNGVVVNTDEPAMVGTYRLVRQAKYIASNAARLVKTPKSKRKR